MRTKYAVTILIIALLLSAAYPALAELDTGDQGEEVKHTTMSDPYLENYTPCTNARYSAWFGAS